jgi:hypothetical protein
MPEIAAQVPLMQQYILAKGTEEIVTTKVPIKSLPTLLTPSLIEREYATDLARPIASLSLSQLAEQKQKYVSPYETVGKSVPSPLSFPSKDFTPTKPYYPYSPFDLPSGFGLTKGRFFKGYRLGLWEFPVKGPKELMKDLW